MAEFTPTHGNHIRVYAATDSNELLDLTQYSDPLDLQNNLLSFQYKFTGAEETSMEIALTIMNPSLTFEDKIMKYYNILFNNKKNNNIPTNTLQFYFRWGYGDKVEQGLSQIITATLTGINYVKTDQNETTIKLSFVDNLTFALKKFATRPDVNVASVVEVDAILATGEFKKASDIIGELLGAYSQMFDNITPVVILNNDSDYAINLNKTLDTVIEYVAGKRINYDEALAKEKKAAGENTVFKIDKNALPNYEQSKVAGEPSQLHKLAGYEIFFKKLGANFTTGYLSSVDVVRKDISIIATKSKIGTQYTAQANIDVPYIPMELILDTNTQYYALDGEEWISNDLSELEGSEYESSLPPGFLKSGKFYYARNGLTSTSQLILAKEGKLPLSFEGRDAYNETSETPLPITQIFPKEYSFWLDNTKKVLIIISYVNQDLLDKKITAYNSSTKGLPEVEAVDLIPNTMFETVDKPLQVNTISGFYSKVSLGKMVGQSAYLQLKALIKNINDFLLPYNDVNNLLTMVTVDKATLTPLQKNSLKDALKLESVENLTSPYYLIITPTGSLKSIFCGGLPEDQIIYSFRELQNKDIFTISLGFKDSIVTDFNFTEDILPLLPSTAISMSTIRQFSELGRDPIQIRETIISELYKSNLNKLGITTIENLISETENVSFNDFVDHFFVFMHGLKQGDYGEDTRNMVLDNSKIRAFLTSIESDEFFNLFYTGRKEPTYYFDVVDGHMVVVKGANYYSNVVLNTSFMNEVFGEDGDITNTKYIRSLLLNYLYREGRFVLRVKTKGVPEFSNPLLDMGSRGMRAIEFKVADTRRNIGGDNLHWLSGNYMLLGYTHTINESGYSTEFDILRNPFVNKQGIFDVL
jgi:hypothetical protein